MYDKGPLHTKSNIFKCIFPPYSSYFPIKMLRMITKMQKIKPDLIFIFTTDESFGVSV